MSDDAPAFDHADTREISIGIAAARYNGQLVDHLLRRTRETLQEQGVSSEAIEIYRVPGSNELPFAAEMLAQSGDFSAIIALGVVVAGETPHHEIIATSTALALQQAASSAMVPVINGIIVCHTRAQAEARTTGAIDRGREFALAAIEMAIVGDELVERAQVSDAWLAENFLGELGDFDELDLLDGDEEDDEEEETGGNGSPFQGDPWKS